MEKYSVLMSVYYKEKAEYFKIAIDSMLSQTLPPDDFVIVCDGPLTEELENLIAYYCEKYPEQFNICCIPINGGLGPALNKGLGLCKNGIVARMDTDDISLPQRMEKQIGFLMEHPEISVVGGQISEFSSDPEDILGYRRVPLIHEEITKRAETRNPMNHVTTVFRKEHVENVGSYKAFRGFEDYHLWVRMLRSGYKFANISDVCCNVRTPVDMYRRRGGFSYFKDTLKMEKFLLKTKTISIFRFISNISIRFVSSCLLDPKIRGKLFMRYMRDGKVN
ncbi:MAG: glycosyltransferase [Ruminococcaceae bacterium]|nr:glycosyltransferase [Oscillospiraceae bacterium]